LWLIKLVAADVEDAIEARAVVFERDLSAELQQLPRRLILL